ncbi:DUF3037 domain-containing protein [Pelagicoccus enzymogenes]|uniref:DUF3037 domain-containing protein n=1 Tax=Pelagicoccus enzymogenes TaxID=2773457 RepID=UPI00280E6E8C|nr:DUF3037 domain-containing protein [Pelagicoccus enzymogenes]MDQ8200681.1 DUF3037 domain-containing protein [Pelagicoccus enzymogenes]
MKTPYSYTILRYVHDTVVGEFANIGVVVYSAESRCLKSRFRNTYGERISKMFPGFDGPFFKKLVANLRSSFEKEAQALESPLEMEPIARDVLSIAISILPRDDSSFQWSPSKFGLTSDLEETLNSLFDRFVNVFDQDAESDSRTDEAVWHSFKEDFEQHKILSSLHSTTIKGEDGEIEFENAYQNGRWHCFEPLSFDLLKSKSIVHKAHAALGKMVSVKPRSEEVKVYYLVGEPHHQECWNAYEKALSILDKSPVEHEIVSERERERFSERFAMEVMNLPPSRSLEMPFQVEEFYLESEDDDETQRQTLKE